MKKLVRKLLIFTFMALLVAVPVTTVTTTNVSAATVKLNKKKLVIKKGKSKKIKLQGVSSKDVKWKTTDKTVAKVKNGKVTAKNVGVCYINATNKKTKKTYKCRVAVPGAIIINPDSTKKSNINGVIDFDYYSYKTVKLVTKSGISNFKWTVSNPKIAKVFKHKGYVNIQSKENAVGRCDITATYKGKVVRTFKINVLDEKGNDPSEASKVLEKPNFKIIDKDGNELLQLDSINQLYRYEYTGAAQKFKSYYTELFKNVSGVFVLKVQNVENPTWQYYYDEQKIPYTTYNDVINKIQVIGTNEKVVYDYDNMTNYDEKIDRVYKGHPGADNSSKILADGTVVGGNNGSSKDCSVSKIKVGDKYYLIEVIFSRKGFEYYRSHYGISPIAALKHDEIFNEDLSAWRSNPTSPLNDIKNKTQTNE